MDYRSRKLMELIRKKFKDKRYITSRYIQRFPSSAEREYTRLINEYMREVAGIVEKHIPEIRKMLLQEMGDDAKLLFSNKRAKLPKSDLVSASTMNRIANEVTAEMKDAMDVLMPTINVSKKVKAFGNMTLNTATNEFSKNVKSTLGIDIRKDYYMGDFYQQEMLNWVEDNVNLIKTVPYDMLDKMQEDIYDGYARGARSEDIAEQIVHDYQVSYNRAKFIARDQIAKLNGDITRAQQQDAGINEYIWQTVGDERVRPGHDLLNGKKFRWDDPPEIMELVGKKGEEHWEDTGRRCNPMQDYNCRCIALPVFDSQTLNLPLANEEDTDDLF